MPITQRFLRTLGLCLFLISPAAAFGQNVSMGFSFVNGGSVSTSGVETALETTYPANRSGRITTATFGWSNSPCPASVKIKVFRPSSPGYPAPPESYAFVGERGPFDVIAALHDSALTGVPPFATQTVSLNPPMDVEANDVIAITNLTVCGGPVYANWTLLAPPPPGGSLIVPGDVTSTVASSTFVGGRWIFLTASGTTPFLGLLSNRFAITLDAMNPRTGATATGVPTPLGNAAGYFSLPDFTGDSSLPEVTVKMVDATNSPALGADFWFFHAPLTDVQYVLTVKDQVTGATRTYSSATASPGQLCGGVDTSAFMP
jgi:hypothetical protein